jgi:hypothetical protein
VSRFLAGDEEQEIQCSPINEDIENNSPNSPSKSDEKIENEKDLPQQSEQNKAQNEFAVEASSIVEHYVSLMEAESHIMMRRLLEQVGKIK